MATGTSTQPKVNPTNINRTQAKPAVMPNDAQIAQAKANAAKASAIANSRTPGKVYSTSFASSAPKSGSSSTAQRIGTTIRSTKVALKK